MRQLLYALRRLRGSPVFTIAATLTLAVAIGATASVFSVVDGVLFKSTGLRDPERLVSVWETSPTRQIGELPTSPATYLDWQTQAAPFVDLAGATLRPVTVTGAAEPQRLRALAVTPNWFAVLGLRPAIGRWFTPDSGGPPEVVISYGYWQRGLGGEASVFGRTLRLDDRPYRIIGVMPMGYLGGTDFWTRLSFTGTDEANRLQRYVDVYGRLKPGITRESAARQIELIARRLAQAYPQTNSGWSVAILPLLAQVEGPYRPALMMVLAAAGCVLLIGIANLTNLFLVRYLAREREIAVRTAIGASRARVLGELVIEAATLGGVAGGVGVGVAAVGVGVLRSLAPTWIPRLGLIGLDSRVVAFCAVTSITAVLILGVLPAWQASRGNAADFLKEGSRGAGSARGYRLQNAFVVLQIAIAIVLLTSTSLLVESFAHFRHIEFGFQPAGVLTGTITASADRYPTPERQAAFVTSVVTDLARQPGVVAASASSEFPGGGADRVNFSVIGAQTPDPTRLPHAYGMAVTADYFRTMKVPMLEGRGTLSTDDRRTVKIVVVDDLLAKRFFPTTAPIGQQIVVSWLDNGARDTMEIVGIVGHIRQGTLTEPDEPGLYVPFAQVPDNSAAIEIRTIGAPEAEAPVLKRVVARLDATVPVYDVQTESERIASWTGATRFATVLASLFALVALVLGAVGIYSVLAYVVSQHRREIAIRIALGATRSHVMRNVLRHAFALTAAGTVLGLCTAWIVTRSLATLFEGVAPHDPGTFAGAACFFALVALAAASVPAFRTACVNPVVALNST